MSISCYLPLSLSVCLSPPSPSLSLSVYLSFPSFSSSLSISPLPILSLPLCPSLHSLSFLFLSFSICLSLPSPSPLSLLLTTQTFSSLAESAYELATPEDESEPNTYSLSTAFEAIVTKIMETADRSGLYWQAGGNQPSHTTGTICLMSIRRCRAYRVLPVSTAELFKQLLLHHIVMQ